MAESHEKITMNFLFKRNNRNRHFQVIKENKWIATGRVFTGLGLYNDVRECGNLSLVGEFSKEYREDIKNFDEMQKKREITYREILDCVMIGTNNDAKKNSIGGKSVTAGWENQI